MNRARRGAAALACAALCAGALASCAFGVPGGGELSVDREREITDQVAREIRSGAPLLTDPVLLAYLNELGQSLVREVEPQPFLYRFSIIRDDSLNAFTIGGGHVYINSGVIAQAGSGAELMGVLAHEIAHVRERHIARRSEGQGLATLATLAAAAAVAVGGADPELLVAAQALNVSLQLRNSRQAESEADREGLAYMVGAGYDPEGMLRFFERIVAASPSGTRELPSYLFTHPAVEERIRDGRSLLSRLPPHPPLRTSEPRLTAMQGRLALLLEPTPGGSGLLARAAFARERSDPLLVQAEQLRTAGDLPGAAAALLRAEELEPADPRVPLARAELAEARMDLDGALPPLRRAFAIDPAVPLVQLRLGELLRRLGNRSEAVFYLEQAAANLRAGTTLQERAEQLLAELPYPPLERSSLGDAPASLGVARFAAGEPVPWRGELAARFAAEPVRVRWLAPDGSVHMEQTLPGARAREREVQLETAGLPAGEWTLEVWVGDVRAERARFALGKADAAPPAVPRP